MQPDYAGLQVDRSNDAPEVLPGPKPIEVSSLRPLERNTSQTRPEFYVPQSPPLYSTIPETGEKRGPHDSQLPPQAVSSQSDPKGSNVQDKRLCGFKRRTCLYLIAAVTVVVIVAIVLGAVLGTVLNSGSGSGSDTLATSPTGTTSSTPSNSTTSISLDASSGFAAMCPSGSSALHVYYQDEQGRIVENQLLDGKWAIQSGNVPQNAVVADDARSGSPLAAISWNPSGDVQRQVFYLNGNDRLMAANTTADNDWSPAYEIPETDPAFPGSIALSACVDTKARGTGLDGIRVYYASSSNSQIQEVGMDFFESEVNIWHAWAQFSESDPNSGVSCALADNVTHVYMRDATTGVIEQWSWNYYDEYVRRAVRWLQAADGPTAAAHTDIAATTDGENTDYVFFQDGNGRIFRALEYGQGLGDYVSLETAAYRSRLASAYGSVESEEGALVMYQPAGTPSRAVYHLLDRSGAEVLSGDVG